MYGLAFDIGTTTIAGSLVDLKTGERLARAGALNPQRQFGADVITRLEAASRSPEMVRRMSSLINGELQRLAAELLRGRDGNEVAAVAFAGNPAMEHLLLGLPVGTLARIPYRPLFTGGRRVDTRDLGWDFPASAYVFPLPGAFVGGDLVAFLYGSGGAAGEDEAAASLFLDLGTNGEIALKRGDALYATSAAAGPAFEGGNLSCGMAAVAGAISGVTITGDRVTVATIGGDPPIGICGSGVIEALDGLLGGGVVDRTGRLLPAAEISSNLAVRIREVNGQPAFVLHQDARGVICLTQDDIRQVQLAKGAIRAGIDVVAARAGIGLDGVRKVVLTGSFGARLRPENLETIGVFTANMVERACFVSEGALGGAERVLCTPGGFAAVERLAAECRVVPLSGNPLFEREFLTHIDFS